MALSINDPELERRLAELGKRQPIPVKKGTMARAILKAATADGRGEPVDKWKNDSRRFSDPHEEAQPAA